MGRVKIYPSVLAADFRCLAEHIRTVEEAGADGIHLDVMDGHFVPNISFGPVVIQWICKLTTLPCWAHLMITEPDKYIPMFHDVGVHGIMVHPELDKDLVLLAKQIKDLGMRAGLAINPDTGLEAIEDVLPLYERVLVMTVYPGFGGQTFMPGPVEKITGLRKIAQKRRLGLDIDVDGGIDAQTAPIVTKAGANCLVAGSAIFAQENPAAALQKIRESAETENNFE